jgi:RNA polymerase sigma factor (sigma-70 family)
VSASCRDDDGGLRVAVLAARRGDERAWSTLVARFGGTIRAIARRHRLDQADQDEVVQRTWLRLVESIHAVRDPAALPGWLATTARRECFRIQQGRAREVLHGDVAVPGEQAAVEDTVFAAERSRALHGALERLPGRERALLRLQLTHPALDYGQIGWRLGMPVGSIGPTRGRSLARLRRDAQLVGVLEAA